MKIPEYFADIAAAMQARSLSIRRDFASHRGSAGGNREGVVRDFLVEHLSKRWCVDTGLVTCSDGLFSSQADLIVADALFNAPFHATSTNKIWPVESVAALFEVKTSLTRSELADAVEKCRRFRQLRRQPFEGQVNSPGIFVICAFESPSPETLKKNLFELLRDVPSQERPDFTLVFGSSITTSGRYLELVRVGEPGSAHRRQMEQVHGASSNALLPEIAEVHVCQEHSLLVWYVWFDSWLRRLGPCMADPLSYLPSDFVAGTKI